MHYRHFRLAIILSSAIAVHLQFARETLADITVVPVNSTQATTNNPLGVDVFNLSTANANTAYYFGNADANANPLFTASRVDLDSSARHYFQTSTNLPANFIVTTDSEAAYVYLSASSGGATTGINFSTYDTNKDGKPDTVFELDFGTTLNDRADDRILAYAYDTALSGINVFAARTSLIPEPTLLSVSVAGVFCVRHRVSRRQTSASRLEGNHASQQVEVPNP